MDLFKKQTSPDQKQTQRLIRRRRGWTVIVGPEIR